ncbi:MAG: hypothetical protein AAGN66_15475 [Acidobacteriota bacterium]
MLSKSCRPNDPPVHKTTLLRASDDYGSGRYREALLWSNEIVAACPREAWGWRFRGDCLMSLGRLSEATGCFDRALDLGGDGTEDTFLWKALAQHQAGNTEGAERTLQDFLDRGDGAGELATKARAILQRLRLTH